MLGMPNIKMDVKMRTVSKLANPMRMQLMEFFIWGLNTRTGIVQNPQLLYTLAVGEKREVIVGLASGAAEMQKHIKMPKNR
jgi:hypothetical protein